MDKYKDYVKARVMPAPQAIEVKEGSFALKDGCKVFLHANSDWSADIVKVFADSWNAKPEVTFIQKELPLVVDGYGLTVEKDSCTISASSRGGVLNALNAMRQMEEAERGVMKASYWQIPCVEINDFPAMAFRGIHFCWFPETPAYEIEKLIRLAAYFRYNYVILESWGVIKLESHPEFCWDEFAVSKTEIRRLVELAASLGITLCPQVNIFGHGTASRGESAKHVLLDKHPEYASLYEADGWTWCISNPCTRQYLTDIVTEIHELFGNPPYFHIGCDEADNAGNCSLCHDDYPRRFKDYLMYFHDLLASRGARSMMWHDMLLNRKDERWKGYIVHGDPFVVSDNFLSELPKDIIICDWQYGYPEKDGKEPNWPTMTAFQQAGFDVLSCPWMERKGIASIGRFTAENHLFGMLETTWHWMCGTSSFATAFTCAANAAWNPFAKPSNNTSIWQYTEFTAHAVRRIGRDMELTSYSQLGTAQYQVPIQPNIKG